MLLVACLYGGVKPDVVVGSLALLRPAVVAPKEDAAWLPGSPPPLDGPALGCFFGGSGFLAPLLVDAAVLTFDKEP